MIRRIQLILWIFVLGLGAMGCGEDGDQKVDAKSHTLDVVFPNDTDEGVVTRDNVPAGVYKVKQVKVSLFVSAYNASYNFEENFKEAGTINSANPIKTSKNVTKLWENVDKDKPFWPYVRLNLPLELQSNAGNLEFSRVTEYWMQWHSDKKDNADYFRGFGKNGENAAATNFYQIAASGEKHGAATYVKDLPGIENEKSMIRMSGNELRIYTTYSLSTDRKEVIFLEFTYSK